jgi:hypothetical protein
MPDATPSAAMSPGAYLRRRRLAAGLELVDIALVTTASPIDAYGRGEWLRLIEEDRTPITADVVETLLFAFPLDRHSLNKLILIHAGARIDPPRLCAGCACSAFDPCRGTDGSSCAWVGDTDLCTTCAAAPLAAGRIAA